MTWASRGICFVIVADILHPSAVENNNERKADSVRSFRTQFALHKQVRTYLVPKPISTPSCGRFIQLEIVGSRPPEGTLTKATVTSGILSYEIPLRLQFLSIGPEMFFLAYATQCRLFSE